MEGAIRFFRKKMCTSYIFNLVIATFVTVVSVIFYQTYLIAKITFFGGIVYFMIPFVLYMKRLTMLKSFFANADDLNQGEYKTIDSSILTQKNIYSYSLDQMVKMDYREIESVQHIDNIFEVARPGYRGNHKVVIKDGKQIVQINVQNEDIADKIMSFIAMKNPRVELMNYNNEQKGVQLNELENWQVSGRF